MCYCPSRPRWTTSRRWPSAGQMRQGSRGARPFCCADGTLPFSAVMVHVTASGQLVALAEVDRGEIVPKRVFNLAGLAGQRRQTRRSLTMSITTARKAEVIKTYGDQSRRHRFAGGPGCDPVGAHQQSDRAFQVPRQGQPFPAWPAQARVAASPVARLPQAHRRRALQDVDRAAGYSPLKRLRAAQVPRA